MSLKAGMLGVYAATLLSSAGTIPRQGDAKTGGPQPTVSRVSPAANAGAEEITRSITASRPGPEHQWLQPLVGSWQVDLTWYSPSGAPFHMTGTSENRWILGGRFLLAESAVGEGTSRIEGTTTYGYDRWEKRFFALGLSTLGGGSNQSWGIYDPADQSFILSRKARDEKTGVLAVYRELLKLQGPDRLSLRVFVDVPRRPPLRILEATFTRR